MIGYDFNEYGESEDEADHAGTFKDSVRCILDIIEEKKFSAQYKRLFINMGGLFQVSELERLRDKKGFRSISWAGNYDFGKKN